MYCSPEVFSHVVAYSQWCRNSHLGYPSIFVHSEQKTLHQLEQIARGEYKIIFACPEMLESPTFSQILHSTSFQCSLSAIYIDEAHLVHESTSWRPAYTRIHQLRTLIGYCIPMVAISATLPSLYRHSLVTFTGLRVNYKLINLGNFRPELSTVILYMEHEHNSFKDLTFLLRDNVQMQDIVKTIIYADDLNILTAMFWFFQSRLSDLGLRTTIVDILHAGLTVEHEEKCLADFASGNTKFLLASEKIGAGMNFLGVSRVVQYLVHGLTLVRWVQRQGRGARDLGSTAQGILIVEKKMQWGQGLSPQAPGNEDPGLLELVQSPHCCQDVLDHWLENPTHHSSFSTTIHLCCSNCYPSLKPAREHFWIMENPGVGNLQKLSRRFKEGEVEKIVAMLWEWRSKVWRDEWRDEWPGYGPKSLVSDADLERVAKNATSVDSLNALEPLVHIVHWSKLADSLLSAVGTAVTAVIGDESMCGVDNSSASCQMLTGGVDAVPLTPNIVGMEENHEMGHSHKGEGLADEQFPNNGVYIAHSQVDQMTQRSTRRTAAQSRASIGKLQPWEQVLQL